MTVVWTFVLIFVIGYMFAVLGLSTLPPRVPAGYTQETFDRYDTSYEAISLKNFGSLTTALLTLLQVLTLDSIANIYRPLVLEAPSGTQGFFNLVYFLLFIFFVSIALMNLVTAVMVEGALQTATADRQSERAHEESRRRMLLPKLRELFHRLDGDGSGEVTLQEIEDAPVWLKDELKTMTHTEDLGEIFELLDDDDSKAVQINEFLEGIFKASKKGDVMMKLQMARLVRQFGAIKTLLLRREELFCEAGFGKLALATPPS
jgi:uncharacterized membrane protein